MSENPNPTHPSAESMQAFLDGELPGREAHVLEAHVAGCARCRTRLEGWRTLFEELDGVATLAPSAAFRERVLEAVPGTSVRPSGARAWLGRSRSGSEHPGSARLQDFLDGQLAARTAARVDAHLDGCGACRGEIDALRALDRALGTLPRLEPSAAFRERVMAEVRVQALTRAVSAPTTRRERLAAWLRRAVPRTPRGWAAAMGVLVAPLATLVLVVQTVFAHPLVTLGSLASFARLKLGGLSTALLEAPGAAALRASPLATLWESAVGVLASPPMAAAGAALLSGLLMAALWIVYRNVIASHPEDREYAHVSL